MPHPNPAQRLGNVGNFGLPLIAQILTDEKDREQEISVYISAIRG
jgi:hypothetical protein